MTRAATAALCLALLPAAPAAAQAIPDHPEKLLFQPIAFQPPVAKDHRVVLKNGMVVYIAEDRALPLVNIALTVRVGSWLEPAGKEGLAGFTGSQLRRGGTKGLTAEELDERLEFLAAQVSTGIGPTSGSAGLNCLSDNLSQALAIFVEMLREPRFQEDRLALAKEQALQEMKKRNDDSADIEAREWGVLVYGAGLLHEPLHDRGLGRGAHARRSPVFPSPALLPGQHDRGGVGCFRPDGDDPDAGGGLRGLAFPEGRHPGHPLLDLDRRGRPLPDREGREPGPGLDRPADREARQTPTSTLSR